METTKAGVDPGQKVGIDVWIRLGYEKIDPV